jgi:hypothetical protein
MLTIVSLLAILALPAQAQYNTRRGAGVGAVTGAVIGGVIGNQNDETTEGALIGGAVGAIAGGAIGRGRDVQEYHAWQYHQHQRQQQQLAYARASSVADIVTMSRNGLSDQVIVNHIRSRGIQHELSVHDIVALHQQGVSESVIAAMQHSAGPARTIAPAPVPVVRPYYYATPPFVARGPCGPGYRHVHGRW